MMAGAYFLLMGSREKKGERGAVLINYFLRTGKKKVGSGKEASIPQGGSLIEGRRCNRSRGVSAYRGRRPGTPLTRNKFECVFGKKKEKDSS